MAEAKKRLLTYAGLKAIEDELENLKVVKRKEVAGKIKEAREQGDLSENAEYDAAKDEQRDIEARIEELEAILKNAEVVVEDEVDLDKINVGCAVKVYDITFDEEMEFKIVGSTEANSLEGKISNESPVGHALIGKKINDVVDVETQAGVIEQGIAQDLIRCADPVSLAEIVLIVLTVKMDNTLVPSTTDEIERTISALVSLLEKGTENPVGSLNFLMAQL